MGEGGSTRPMKSGKELWSRAVNESWELRRKASLQMQTGPEDNCLLKQ